MCAIPFIELLYFSIQWNWRSFHSLHTHTQTRLSFLLDLFSTVALHQCIIPLDGKARTHSIATSIHFSGVSSLEIQGLNFFWKSYTNDIQYSATMLLTSIELAEIGLHVGVLHTFARCYVSNINFFTKKILHVSHMISSFAIVDCDIVNRKKIPWRHVHL